MSEPVSHGPKIQSVKADYQNGIWAVSVVYKDLHPLPIRTGSSSSLEIAIQKTLEQVLKDFERTTVSVVKQ